MSSPVIFVIYKKQEAMNICIGPVCVPIGALIPFVLMLLQPLANWVRRMRGIKEKDEDDSTVITNANGDEMVNGNPIGLDTPKDADGPFTPLISVGGIRQRKAPSPGVVQAVKSVEEWQKLVATAEQKDIMLVVKFTAKW